MGQDTSGTSIVANATARSRKISCLFLVDWADDGFGNDGFILNNWTDETENVIDVRGTHQAVGAGKSIAAVGHGVSDVVYVKCRNPEETGGYSGLRYSATNSNGSLYANIQEGRINMKRAVLFMGLDDIGAGSSPSASPSPSASLSPSPSSSPSPSGSPSASPSASLSPSASASPSASESASPSPSEGFSESASPSPSSSPSPSPSAGATDYLRQITGYIVSVTESYKRREVTFEVRDRASDAVLTRTSTDTQVEVTAKDYLETLCAEFGRDAVAAGDQLFDSGVVAVPYYWLDDDTLWDEMHHVAEAHLGRIWFDKDGNLHFDDGGHFVKPNANSYDDPTTSQATFTVASFADLSPEYKLNSVYNHIIVEYTARYAGYPQPIFNASDIVILQPGEANKIYKAQFANPVLSVTLPAEDIDYHAVTPGGRDLTSTTTVTVNEDFAGYAELYLTNGNGNYPAYLTLLELRGVPLLTQEPVKYETEDATSIGYYGRRTWTVRSNPYVQSYRHAEMIGDFLLQRFKDPVLTVQLRGVPARPWLEVGDRVTVTETKTDLNEDFFISQINWQWSPGRTSYLMDLSLMRASDLFTYTNYFIIGTTNYGSGGPGTYGRLFW